MGIALSVLAGMLICLQGVFNTRASEKVGLWETVALVHGVGLIAALVLVHFLDAGGLKRLGEVNPLYYTGGILGAVIVYSVMKGFCLLGPSAALAVVFISQIVAATAVETFGWFGTVPVALSAAKVAGIALMIIGVLLL